MANPELALKHLGKLLGLFPDSGVDWKWFDDPEKQTLTSLRKNRDELADILAALIDGEEREPTKQFGTTALHWEPFPAVGPFEIGPVWTAGDENQPLQIGVGAIVHQGPVTLDIVVWLFELRTDGSFHSLLGNGQIDGDLTFSDTFLASVGAHLAIAIDKPDKVKGSITVTSAEAGAPSRTLDSTTPLAALPWDLVRIGTFIVGSWMRWKAVQAGADDTIKRLAYHLFPMFGEAAAPGAPANPIAPLPPFSPMTTTVVPESLLAWPKSLVKIDGMNVDTAGAQAFLGHASVLLTGDTKPHFFDGSVLVQIAPATPGDGGPIAGLPPVFTSEGGVPVDQSLTLLGVRWDGPDLPAGKKVQVFQRKTHANAAHDPDTILVDIDGAWKPSFKANLASLATPPLPLNFGLDFAATPPAFTFQLASAGVVSVGMDNPPTVKLGGAKLDSAAGFLGGALTLLDALLGAKGHPWLPALAKILHGEVPAGVQMLIVGMLDQAGVPDPIKLVDEPLPGGLGNLEVTLHLPSVGAPRFGFMLDFKVGDALDSLGLHLGAIDFGFELAIPIDGTPPKFEKVSIELIDLRLKPDAGIGALIQQFLPDLTKIEGLGLKLTGGLPDAPFFAIEGGGRIPIEEKLGPLDLRSLLIKVGMKAVSVSVDATFDLAGIIIAPYELGISYDFKTGKVLPQLNGLGLSMDLSGLTMGGMFAKYEPPGGEPDYLGALQISVFDLFQLSAIGGYSQIKVKPGSNSKEPSLFIFANLDAPLGGPPYFFVTGISGGFGYNRRLPPVFPLQDNPFLKVMRGEIAFDPEKGMRESLEMLGQQFAPTPGGFWVAAGLEFTSCGFINGTLGAAIGVNPFQLQIFGAAGFGIENLAYLELEFGTVVDTEKVLTIAGLTHNSYLIHPDLFGLQGQFGLGVWHSGPNAGDFVLSIGGYHPLYTPPAHYPAIERIEVRASLWGFLNLNVSCFFTATPRELMAGASVSLWGEFAGIAAGLDVYVDVLIKWDPFKLLARMGVCVWFEFLGRHELGVDLEIHTPPFGGTATIDLFIVSFTIEFGDDDDVDDRLPLGDFITRQLRLTPHGSSVHTVPSLSSADEPGLFRVDVGWGRTTEKAESKDDEAQEGLAANKPIPVQVEFGLVVKSRLPLMNVKRDKSQTDLLFKGQLDLPLSKLFDLPSHTRITVKKKGGAIVTTSSEPIHILRRVPASLYSGVEVEAGQMDNRVAAVEASAKAERTVDGIGGFTLEYEAEGQPVVADPMAGNAPETETEPIHWYPLPLKPLVGVAASAGVPVHFGKLRASTLFRGATVKKATHAAPPPPPAQPAVREAAIPRVRQAKVAGAARPTPTVRTLAGVPAGVPIMAVPSSPVRRNELADVTLRMVPRQPMRSRAAVRRPVSTGRLSAAPRRLPMIAAPARRDLAQGLRVAPGRALHVELSRDGAVGGTVKLEAQPNQVVRSIFLGGLGRPLADLHTRGPSTLAIPARARRLVLIGEEDGAHLFEGGAPMGLEARTLVIALEEHSFAAHGCVIDVQSGLEVAPAPLTVLDGREVLRVARHLTAHFPALAKGAAVALVRAVVADPAPASQQVRWRGHGATLGAIRAVTRDDLVAVVIPVAADGAWSLELSIGRDYRLEGVVALGHDAAALAGELASSSDWTLLDGRWTSTPTRAGVAAVSAAAVGAVGVAATPVRTLEGAAIARVELSR